MVKKRKSITKTFELLYICLQFSFPTYQFFCAFAQQAWKITPHVQSSLSGIITRYCRYLREWIKEIESKLPKAQ